MVLTKVMDKCLTHEQLFGIQFLFWYKLSYTLSDCGCKYQMHLKQHYVEIHILSKLPPPTVSECDTTVTNTNPRSVTIW